MAGRTDIVVKTHKDAEQVELAFSPSCAAIHAASHNQL